MSPIHRLRLLKQTETIKQTIVTTVQDLPEALVFTAYIVVTLLAAAINTFSATADFLHVKQVAIQMEKAGVPESWLNPLAALKAAGALGLLIGIGVPLIGVAAAAGLVLFFVGAIITHLRARYFNITFPVAYLVPALASLVLRIATYH
jgi:hypothetical protein